MISYSVRIADPQAIIAYRELRHKVRSDAQELLFTDEELLFAIGAIREKKEFLPTIAGLVLFGKEWSLRRLFPISTRIDYITIEGRQWVPDPEKRYTGLEFRESILLNFSRILNTIMRDIPETFVMQLGEVYRQDVPLVPRIVIKEAFCNCIMLRDYRDGQTIQILRYANRIEFRNAGYSLKPEEQLGLPGSMTRNGLIAKVMQDLNLAETKGTGIRTMQEEMRKANLSIPLFESSRSSNSFALTLLTHHLFDQSDIEWLGTFSKYALSNDEARALIVVREMGAITNADYRNINSIDILSASTHLRRLRNLGLLEQKGNGNTTYYIPTSKLLIPPIETFHSLQESSAESYSDNEIPKQNSLVRELTTQVDPLVREPNLPEDLKHKIENLKNKSSDKTIRLIIQEICSIKPFKLVEIARLLNRNPKYLRKQFLFPMVKERILNLRHPHQPNHPQQAYRSIAYAPSTSELLTSSTKESFSSQKSFTQPRSDKKTYEQDLLEVSLPENLKYKIDNLKNKNSEKIIRCIIQEICAIRPFKAAEIAKLLNKGQEYLRRQFLLPMVKEKVLNLLYPHHPNHPQQAYQTKFD